MPFFVGLCWAIAAVLFAAGIAATTADDWAWSAASCATALATLVFVEGQRREVSRAKAEFERRVAEYQKSISTPLV